jgi:hypothetical protein
MFALGSRYHRSVIFVTVEILGSFVAQLIFFRVVLDRHVSEATHYVGWFAFAMVIALVVRLIRKHSRSAGLTV